MKFSEQEIKSVWDEVARLIGDSVMQLRHRGEELTVESLSRQLAQHQATCHDVEQRIMIAAAINMLKDGK
ncbi:MAG: hypothetical protein ACRDCA_11730 [Serratia sp. (in: enterobacteria)]|uniref:hypothetical protein n=1 Tax=Serratia sp. (in: enterobacteria) TaxID=616 RepID=UPI003F40BD44